MRYLLLILTAYFCLGAYLDESKTTNVNLLSNPGFEQGIARWTNSGGGTLTRETGSNVGVGDSSGAWDASAASDTLTSEQVTIPTGLQNRFCSASFIYKGGDANLTAEVIDGSLAVLASQVLSAQTDFQAVDLAFTCPSSGTLAIRINASADAAIIYLDQAFIGKQSSSVSHSVSPTVYELTKTAVGTVGSSGQIRAGHVLTDDSFRAYTTDISYYNLTGLTDNSTNSRTLSNNNSVVFTGTDIFGSAGIASFNGTNNLFSNDAFFTSSLSSTWSLSGWFKAADWSDAGTLISVWDGTPNIGPRIETFSGNIRYSASDDGTASDFVDVAIPNILDNDWHHVAMVYDGTFLIGYFDGKEVARFVFAGQAAISGTFAIGARYVSGAAGGFFTGQAQEVYFVDGSMDAQEVKRTFAAKIPHNANIPVEYQSWFGTFYNSNDDVISDLQDEWLVAKEPNVIYTDINASSVLLRMQNQSISATSIPIKTYTTGLLSAAPTFPLNHGLPCTPQDFYLRTEGQTTAGDWDKRYDLLSVNGTQILGPANLSSILTINGTHRLEIVASCAPIAVSVPVADPTTVGTVSTSTQTFAGVKEFEDGVQGVTDGSVALSGIIGEQITNSINSDFASASTATDIWVDVTGLDVTLTAGSWLIILNGIAGRWDSGLVVGNFHGLVVGIRDSLNNVIATGVHNDYVPSGGNMGWSTSVVAKVDISSSETYKISILSHSFGGAADSGNKVLRVWGDQGVSGETVLRAIRIR